MPIPEEEKTKFAKRIYQLAKDLYEAGKKINPAVCAAQAVLESRYGESALAQKGENLFGIKAGRKWDGDVIQFKTKEWDKTDGWHEVLATFRKYETESDCLEDYCKIIEKLPWYSDAANNPGNYKKFLAGLMPKPGREPGWATDPRYFQKVESIIFAYEWDSEW